MLESLISFVTAMELVEPQENAQNHSKFPKEEIYRAKLRIATSAITETQSKRKFPKKLRHFLDMQPWHHLLQQF